jgi:hypothetical protein
VAHLSLDTDGNVPALAETMLEALAEAEAPATWCTILPGYDAGLTDRIRQARHELAMHFDAMSDGAPWTEEAFDAQHAELTAKFGEAPITNKNHYLRWEGDTEFFGWCERVGIEMDQSKGASKTGEAGFNFGTCQPHFPVDPDGHVLNVLELPTPTQDLVIFAPPALLPPLLSSAMAAHGVLHVLFHPYHIQTEGVREALLETVRTARASGVEWWTAYALNAWERARRTACWQGSALTVGTGLPEATLMCLGASAVRVNGEAQIGNVIQRWGFKFATAVLDVLPDTSYRVEAVP